MWYIIIFVALYILAWYLILKDVKKLPEDEDDTPKFI